VSTERSFSGELVQALASNLRGQRHYHGEPRRARGARGGDGARSEMEGPAVRGGGRNGQLRRALVRVVVVASACACSAAASAVGGNGREQGRRMRARRCRRARRDAGATGWPGAVVADAWRRRGDGPLPWSGRWRVRRAGGASERARWARPPRPWAGKWSVRPTQEEISFSFYFLTKQHKKYYFEQVKMHFQSLTLKNCLEF
jgi:hypothetical protein